MGVVINSTVATGVLVGGAFAVDDDLGMMAAGGLGAFYACFVGTISVMRMMGFAANSIAEFFESDDDEAIETIAEKVGVAAKAEEEKKKQHDDDISIPGRLLQIYDLSDREMQKMQNIARK